MLRELQKRGLLPGLDFGLFTWMNAICTPIPTWQRSGSGGAAAERAGGRGGQRIAVYGALDYASGQVLWQTAAKKDGAGFAAFLEQIAQRGPRRIWCWCSTTSATIAPRRCARGGRTRTVGCCPSGCRPTAPNLNLLERVWRFLKQKLACHRFWADPDGLRQAAATLLDQTEARFHAPIDQPFAWDTIFVNPLRAGLILVGREGEAAVGVVAAGVSGGDGVDGAGGGRDQPVGSAFSGGPEALLDLGEGQLDRVEVGRIGWQEEQAGSGRLERRRASALLWALRLSRTTIWPGRRVGASSCSA